jgi:hypothetical protein
MGTRGLGALGILVGILIVAGDAPAKPPSEDTLPPYLSVVRDLRERHEEAVRAEREAARDEDQEFLDAYAAAPGPGTAEEHRRVVEIIDNRKFDREKPGIREKAASILARRWPLKRSGTLRTRRIVSGYLIPLLQQRGHDTKSNELAIKVLTVMWGTDGDYKLDGDWRERNKAINEWKKRIRR